MIKQRRNNFTILSKKNRLVVVNMNIYEMSKDLLARICLIKLVCKDWSQDENTTQS